MQENNSDKETSATAATKAAIELDYFLKLPPKQREQVIAYLKDLLSAK